MDKNQAVIAWLLQCEGIKDSPLYFNITKAKNGAKGLITLSNDTSINKPYIDGSVLKRYQLTVQDFRSVSENALVRLPDKIALNENVNDFDDVQALLDWIKEQNENRSYPDFGGECLIEDVSTTTDNPRLDQIDATVTPPLARYSFTITIQYLDISKRNW